MSACIGRGLQDDGVDGVMGVCGSWMQFNVGRKRLEITGHGCVLLNTMPRRNTLQGWPALNPSTDITGIVDDRDEGTLHPACAGTVAPFEITQYCQVFTYCSAHDLTIT